MAASRPCEECGCVRRCRLFVDHGVVVYLCARCARALGFTETIKIEEGMPRVNHTEEAQ